MKPLGIDAAFRLVRPSRAEDKIWEAVAEAISEGWTPKQFRMEAAEAWEQELKDAAKQAVADLTSGQP